MEGPKNSTTLLDSNTDTSEKEKEHYTLKELLDDLKLEQLETT